jgi:hypothetical protein
MGPPVGICCCALAAVPKETAKIRANIVLFINGSPDLQNKLNNIVAFG